MHFDLEFADVMRERRGFDLIVGNPPWVKPAWSDPAVLSVWMPEIALRKFNAAKVDSQKEGYFKHNQRLLGTFFRCMNQLARLQSFLSAGTNYPFVNGGSPNLYQCFIDLSFRLVSKSGVAALIHQDSHLQEPRSATLRDACFSRLRYHFLFRNELYQKMFAEVNHSEVYSANIYSGKDGPIHFEHVSGLFVPSTIDDCMQHDGVGEVPGIRRKNTGRAWAQGSPSHN